jgi:RNA polymerase sigma-70 factor (ECF subfamily)
VTDTTHGSLLLRVRNPRDEEGWRAFYDIYSPLILRYAQTRGLRPADAEEVLQECMTALARTMRTFEYSPEKGRFKAWLRSMVNNQVANLQRRAQSGRPVSSWRSSLTTIPASPPSGIGLGGCSD